MRDEYDVSQGGRNRYADRSAGRPLSTPTTRSEQPRTGVVEIFRDDTEAYRWRLQSPDGDTLATSARSYPTLEACRAAVECFLRAATSPDTIHAA